MEEGGGATVQVLQLEVGRPQLGQAPPELEQLAGKLAPRPPLLASLPLPHHLANAARQRRNKGKSKTRLWAGWTLPPRGKWSRRAQEGRKWTYSELCESGPSVTCGGLPGTSSSSTLGRGRARCEPPFFGSLLPFFGRGRLASSAFASCRHQDKNTEESHGPWSRPQVQSPSG